ncbi:MAG: hypothetical protein HY043_19060 [Verrucomicrobia bacterium]|nr:hypothetical protein [Verrucomicrobiota bacterium]
MKPIAPSIALTLSGLIAAGVPFVVFADVAQNPYKVISARNGFDLKPPPPPPSSDTTPPPPPKSDLKFTGISKIGNVKRAHIASADPKKAGQLTFFDIEEGASQDGIEVVEIDMATASVKIRNGGIESVLTFEKNAISPAKPGVVPLNPIPPTPGQPVPGGTASQPNNGPVIVGARNNPNTPSPTFAQPVPTVNPGMPGAAVGSSTSGSTGLRSIPSRNVRTAPSNPPNNLSAEEQVILLEAQRQRAAQRGIELPPTPGIPSIPGAPVPGGGK